MPNKIGAISLNTLYWYDSNKGQRVSIRPYNAVTEGWLSTVVDGCKKGEPGDLQLDWLEVQLDMFRARGMQVWLSGHVPPSPGNYVRAWQK